MKKWSKYWRVYDVLLIALGLFFLFQVGYRGIEVNAQATDTPTPLPTLPPLPTGVPSPTPFYFPTLVPPVQPTSAFGGCYYECASWEHSKFCIEDCCGEHPDDPACTGSIQPTTVPTEDRGTVEDMFGDYGISSRVVCSPLNSVSWCPYDGSFLEYVGPLTVTTSYTVGGDYVAREGAPVGSDVITPGVAYSDEDSGAADFSHPIWFHTNQDDTSFNAAVYFSGTVNGERTSSFYCNLPDSNIAGMQILAEPYNPVDYYGYICVEDQECVYFEDDDELVIFEDVALPSQCPETHDVSTWGYILFWYPDAELYKPLGFVLREKDPTYWESTAYFTWVWFDEAQEAQEYLDVNEFLITADCPTSTMYFGMAMPVNQWWLQVPDEQLPFFSETVYLYPYPYSDPNPFDFILSDSDIHTELWYSSDIASPVYLQLQYSGSPWVRYPTWVCLDEDYNVIDDGSTIDDDFEDILDEWVDITDGDSVCFPLPINALKSLFYSIRSAVSFFASLIFGDETKAVIDDLSFGDAESAQLCLFPRVVSLKNAFAFLNTPAVLIYWVLAGLVLYMALTK